MKTVLVLGGSGFIGVEIVKNLLDNNYKVIVLSHRNKLNIQHPNLDYIQGALYSLCLKKIKNKPDFIVHVARINSSRGKTLGRYWAAFRGYIANKKIIKQVSEFQIPIIYISGSLMYGNNEEYLVSENQRLNPTSFAKQYILAEKPFLQAIDKKNKNVCMVRVPWVLGNGSWFKSFYKNFIEQKKNIPLYSEKTLRMSLIHVEDVANGIFDLLQHFTEGIKHISTLNTDNISFINELSTQTGYSVKNVAIHNTEQAVREAFTHSIWIKKTEDILYREKYPTLSSMIKSVL